jgi:hypothetical protein
MISYCKCHESSVWYSDSKLHIWRLQDTWQTFDIGHYGENSILKNRQGTFDWIWNMASLWNAHLVLYKWKLQGLQSPSLDCNGENVLNHLWFLHMYINHLWFLHTCMYIDFVCVSTIISLDIRTVQTVWYFLFIY